MKRIKLAASKREPGGKGAARRLRRDEQIPAVVYGQGLEESIPVAISHFDVTHNIHAHEAHNFIIDLEVDGTVHPTIIASLQQDPLTEEYYHIDFYRISMDKAIHTKIPVILEGTAPGVKEGGIVEQVIREIEISCLPLEMPDLIPVDISHLEIGDTVHVYEIEPPEGVEFLVDGEDTIVHVRPPRVLSAKDLGLEEEEEGEELEEGEEGAEEGEEGEAGEDAAEAEE
jgi:large subunit ribosomal protein L25